MLKHFGADTRHASLPELDSILASGRKNVVFMLFDGLGAAIVRKHLPRSSFLRKNMITEVTSVFPPTTVAAITSAESGLTPAEHGWLGWSLYFKEIDANVDLFQNTLSGSDGVKAAEQHMAEKCLPYADILKQVSAASAGTVETTRISPFSGHKLNDSGDICTIAEEICSQPGQHFIYTYWYKPDYEIHGFGTKDKSVHDAVRKIDSRLKEMCGRLSDTLVIVTADHGLIDTDFVYLEDFPEIAAHLLRPPSIECRAMNLFIKEGHREAFEADFNKAFGKLYKLFDKARVMELKLFGDGTPHPKVDEFLGDYLAVAIGKKSIAYKRPAPDDLVFKAHHAGLTEAETMIPVIAINVP